MVVILKRTGRQILKKAAITVVALAAFSVFPKLIPKTDTMTGFGIPAAQAENVRDDQRVKKLIKKIKDPYSARWETRNELIKIGKPAVDPLLELFKKEKDTNIRKYAAMVLGEIGDAKPVPVLVRALKKERDDELLTEIIIALKNIGDPSALPALVGTLLPKLPQSCRVSETSAKAIGAISRKNLKNPQVVKTIQLLKKKLKTKSCTWREIVAMALGEVNDPSVVPALVSAMKRGCEVLSIQGSKDYYKHYKMWGEFVGLNISHIIQRMGKRAIPGLIDTLEKSKNRADRENAADTLRTVLDLPPK